MKKLFPFITIFLVTLSLLTTNLSAQTAATTNVGDVPETDSRPARTLFEDADKYITRKYEDFNRRKLGFDPKLESATKQEQKDLAAQNAAILAARARSPVLTLLPGYALSPRRRF